MNSTKTRSTPSPKKKRAARERQSAYATRTANGKQRPRPARESKLVVEMYGGEPYEFYPLGKYIVAAPGVCGGRPTIKYTRIDTRGLLEMIAGGWSIKRVVDFYQRAEVTREAVQEAILLANEALLKTSTVTAIEA